MTALATARAQKTKRYTNFELAATASLTYWRGGILWLDTSTGLLTNVPSTTTIPVGTSAEDVVLGAGGGTLIANLFWDVFALWMVNSAAGEAVAAANIGGLAYSVDDQTVQVDDSTNTKPVLGRIWAVDAVKGVLVEPLTAVSGKGTVSGLD